MVECLLNDERIRSDTDLARVLHVAARDGCADIAKLVLSRCDTDSINIGSENTLISVAAENGHLDVFKILIGHRLHER